jgi:hypothetical protein
MWKKCKALFQNDYKTKFKGRLLALRRILGMRLNIVATAGADVEEIYNSPVLIEGFIENQLRDLYTLLNEFERQNGLAVTEWKDRN